MPYEPKPRVLMSSTGLAGTARISPASTFEVARWNSAGFAKPDEIWQSLSLSFFMTGAARERLQNHRPGCSLAPSSMNDFQMFSAVIVTGGEHLERGAWRGHKIRAKIFGQGRVVRPDAVETQT